MSRSQLIGDGTAKAIDALKGRHDRTPLWVKFSIRHRRSSTLRSADLANVDEFVAVKASNSKTKPPDSAAASQCIQSKPVAATRFQSISITR
jgi:hypothetical protein